jgi:hypothetical protein
MVGRAKVLETRELKFFTSIYDAANKLDCIDLLFSSGTLQCVPNPSNSLGHLLSFRPGIVVLARLALALGASTIVTTHTAHFSTNGPGPLPIGYTDDVSKYPFIIPTKSEVESILSRDYDILLTQPDPSGVFPVNSEAVRETNDPSVNT